MPKDGEAEPESIHAMAENYADRLHAVHPTGPYKILGWSFGGVVAHQLAVELRRRGCEVQRLVLLDPPAFGAGVITTAAAAGGGALNEGQILEHILRTNRIDIPLLPGPLTYERAEEILQRGAVEFPLPPKELLELMVRSVETNQRHLRRHVPEVFDGDMVVFSAARSGSTNDVAPPNSSRGWRSCRPEWQPASNCGSGAATSQATWQRIQSTARITTC